MLGPKLALMFALAMTGQAPKSPGVAGPAQPQKLVAAIPHSGDTLESSRREWIAAVSQVDGKTYLISAWRSADGSPRFDPREYPDFVPRPGPGPAPEPPAGPATPGPRPSWPYPQLGVIKDKVPRPVAGQAWYGGNAVRSIEAADAGEPRSRPPDVHLTVIGSEAEQARARERLAADPKFRALEASMGDRLAVQFYGPADPMVARVGLVDGGKPDVVVQDASGKERRRFHADPGPDPIVAEIRKADPSYRPGRDDAGGVSIPSGATYFLLGVGAVGGWLLYQRSRTVPS